MLKFSPSIVSGWWIGDKILDLVMCMYCFYNENNNFSILGKKLQYLLEPYHVTESNTLTLWDPRR